LRCAALRPAPQIVIAYFAGVLHTETPAGGRPGHVSNRILLVEDEANILEAIGFILSRDGWEVLGHGKGETALAEIARVEPDILVLDVMLPGRSGLDILRELRDDPAKAALPVLMLTAKGQARDREQAMALGANAFLTKPFSNDELVATVRALANGTRRQGTPHAAAGHDPARRRLTGRTVMARRVFLERRTYRMNRLQDAARLLPVLGMILFFGPVFISDDGGARSPRRGRGAGGVAGLLLRRVAPADRHDDAGQPRAGRAASVVRRGAAAEDPAAADMLSFDGLVAVCVLYVMGLFGVAFLAEKRAMEGKARWLNSPVTYTLSLSIYTTAWTFYGAVGSAARSGLEFLTIYLGPTLVFIGWYWLLRKMVRIGRAQRITSIADMISSRYGKSGGLAALVTVLAVLGTTPYIALQLQSVTLSFEAFARPGALVAPDTGQTAVWVAGGLALFTIVFGTRSLDLNERHPGLVSAIALEAIVKLFAILAVGIFVVWGVADGPSDMLARIEASPVADADWNGARWLGLTALSAFAILCLPRMFQVLVVENSDERHLATAAWAFPLYLCLISLFVVPIAVIGLSLPEAGTNPDLFVLTVPLGLGRDDLALLVFLGGFSAATSMVIVAALALSTMVSNHIIVPLWLRATRHEDPMSGDMRRVALMARRLSIGGILFLGLGYYRLSGGADALAEIGLIAFLGVAQVLPALLGGILWRGATRVGAALGIGAGFAIWAWLLLIPNIAATGGLVPPILDAGPFGLAWLSPATPLGLQATDPLLTAMILSLGVNTLPVHPRLAVFLPEPAGAASGRAIRQCLRSFHARFWAGAARRGRPTIC
jgi:Na+/proline symporter/DNA-binding response OmpR family regulator